MKRAAKIAIFFLLMIIGIGALAIYWTFYRPLPDYESTVEISRLSDSVKIKWDNYGIPHIYASNKDDLYTAVGYVHAQDRLWQMTLSQMAAQGRFAEFLGPDLLPLDKMQRTIGFWRIAKKMETQLPDSTHQLLEAYAEGVNRYAEDHRKELPIQFSLTGMNPISWTPTHSLALARLMAWELNIAWKAELTYNLLFHQLSAEQFNILFPNPHISADRPPTARADSTTVQALHSILNTQQHYDKLRNTQGMHTGSNAWAVSSRKSDTGKPLLAGDPHLALSIPGKWYEVHLNLNGRNLSGATLPGTPSVILGQNDRHAWSFTNVMLDDTDFFEERLHPTDTSRYLLDSLAGQPVYQEFITQREIIKVKGEDDRLFTRRLTKHGPVISDIYPEQMMTRGQLITMQWTGQAPSNELQALQTMGWAESFDEFRSGVRQFRNPAQNIVYADSSGNIGLFTAANIPMRNGNPIIVRKGWQPDLDWQGYVPPNELPSQINPEKGWVANANNSVAADNYPNYISVYWQPDSRYQRIQQYLTSSETFSPEAFQVMQNDTYSYYARALVQQILPTLENSTEVSFDEVVSYLSNWDYTYDKSETAASIADIFLLHLTRNTLQDEMGRKAYESFIRYSAKPAQIMIRLLRDNSSFFDDITTSEQESKGEVIRQSMHQTLTFLNKNYGNESAEWHWENLHTLTLRPTLFGRAAEDSSTSESLKLIVRNVLSKGPYPAAGNSMSINNGEYLWTKPYEMAIGPSIRRIIDLSNLQQSLSIMPGGQSGNPISNYYNDQTQSWLNGQYKFILHDSTRLERPRTMQLIPSR